MCRWRYWCGGGARVQRTLRIIYLIKFIVLHHLAFREVGRNIWISRALSPSLAFIRKRRGTLIFCKSFVVFNEIVHFVDGIRINKTELFAQEYLVRLDTKVLERYFTQPPYEIYFVVEFIYFTRKPSIRSHIQQVYLLQSWSHYFGCSYSSLRIRPSAAVAK